MVTRLSVLLLGVGLLVLAGCSSTPTAPDQHATPAYHALQTARTAVAKAEQTLGPGVNAQRALKRSRHELGRAESRWQHNKDDMDDASVSFITTHAYLARRYAQIAQARARSASADRTWRNIVARHGRSPLRRNGYRAHPPMGLRGLRKAINASGSGASAMRSGNDLVVTFPGARFASNSARVPPAYGRTLNKVAAYLRRGANHRVEVDGYADSTGPSTHNRNLSLRRAGAVRRALVSRRVDPAQISIHGYGESHPIASNATAAGRIRNRRVVLMIH